MIIFKDIYEGMVFIARREIEVYNGPHILAGEGLIVIDKKEDPSDSTETRFSLTLKSLETGEGFVCTYKFLRQNFKECEMETFECEYVRIIRDADDVYTVEYKDIDGKVYTQTGDSDDPLVNKAFHYLMEADKAGEFEVTLKDIEIQLPVIERG